MLGILVKRFVSRYPDVVGVVSEWDGEVFKKASVSLAEAVVCVAPGNRKAS